MQSTRVSLFLLTALSAWQADWASAIEIDSSGYISIEPRVFLQNALLPSQPDAGLSPSAVIAPEIRYAWNDGEDRITVSPFWRWDADDQERSHSDLREAVWLHIDGSWTWQVGLGRVFWGVTESRHLVDIVNQTDQVEDLDEEDKLGQPMISVERWTSHAGTFGLYILTGFRERTFPTKGARLQGLLPVDTGRSEYDSSREDKRLDWALRWTRATGSWDIGLSAFHGTSREPRLRVRADSTGAPVLIPRYDVINQTGLDLQYTKNAWLWKLEAIGRTGHGKAFLATVAGFEYTLFNLGDSGVDLGILAEHLYDGRGSSAPMTLYDNDWFVGARMALNDTQDTALLAGAILDNKGTFSIVEAQRRLGDLWKLEFEARLFGKVNSKDPLLGGFERDSFFTLRIARYL